VRLNIFSIPADEIADLQAKLKASRMKVIQEVDQDGWHGQFYFSISPAPTNIPWVETYRSYFEGMDVPRNRNYYAAFLFTRGTQCFAISYGKSHFYLRPFCDYDFGVEVAKRIADDLNTKQTASKRFQGRRKKDIRSFGPNTRLDVESGESVDYLQAAIIPACRETFGKSGKFGASALLEPDISPTGLGAFLSKLTVVVTNDARFTLPRTIVLQEKDEVARYDALLVDELMAPLGAGARQSPQMWGLTWANTPAGHTGG
jgi:uncharacterized protein (TIGR04141 family)